MKDLINNKKNLSLKNAKSPTFIDHNRVKLNFLNHLQTLYFSMVLGRQRSVGEMLVFNLHWLGSLALALHL